jgi:predicted MFS family arabinose efflux permease
VQPWGSAQVLGAFAVAAVSLTSFALVERRAKEPILPFELFRNPTVAAGVAAIALSAMAMVGTIAFVPLFVQGVIGTSATSSGVVLTPFMLGAVIASALSGQWISRSGRYRPNALVGPIILGAGLFLLSRMDTSTTNAQAASYMVVAGVGLGLMMQVFVIAVQNQVPLRAIGSATALTQFMRSIGSTIGVTAMGVIVNHGLPKGSHLDRQAVHRLPPHLRQALADAMHPAFLAGTGVCVVTWVIVAIWLKEVPLRRELEEPTLEAASPGVAPTRAR